VAIRAARESARINNITNAQFVAGDAGDIFEIVNVQIPVSERDSTVVILDPPRAGCDEKFLKQLFRFHPKKIVYVSCDPATQARDAKIIVNAGYRVVDITPFDLFPQTRHIENVISFIK
jgi:23S rRNA (uracil1939-C5)-methyltransferase/tRNA (uracil-5-)-methyltransferase